MKKKTNDGHSEVLGAWYRANDNLTDIKQRTQQYALDNIPSMMETIDLVEQHLKGKEKEEILVRLNYFVEQLLVLKGYIR